MIHNVFEFADSQLRHMIPRTDIAAIDVKSAMMRFGTGSKGTLFPYAVYENSIDNISFICKIYSFIIIVRTPLI